MPLAAAVSAPSRITQSAVAVALACAALVLCYSFIKARRGDWAHIDASLPRERKQFNLFVGLGLCISAVALWLTGLSISIAVAVAASGAVVLAGHLLRRFAKASLHVAFAVFAAFLVWPNYVAVSVLLVVAILVGWSRLELERHVLVDIAFGALIGVWAGVLFHALIGRLVA
jgi:membrane-associated phospholipid phosphatase